MQPEPNLTEYTQGNAVLRHRIQSLKETVTQHWFAISKADSDAVKKLSRSIENLIIPFANERQIRTVLNRVEHAKASGSWSDVSLIHTPKLRAGVIELYADNTIPMHNHPACIGLLVPISGELTVDQLDLDVPLESLTRGKPLRLHRIRQTLVGRGDFSLILPDLGNVHRLHSCGSKSCIFLDILICRTHFSDRHWFFPLESTNKRYGTVRVQPVSDGTLRSVVMQPRGIE